VADRSTHAGDRPDSNSRKRLSHRRDLPELPILAMSASARAKHADRSAASRLQRVHHKAVSNSSEFARASPNCCKLEWESQAKASNDSIDVAVGDPARSNLRLPKNSILSFARRCRRTDGARARAFRSNEARRSTEESLRSSSKYDTGALQAC